MSYFIIIIYAPTLLVGALMLWAWIIKPGLERAAKRRAAREAADAARMSNALKEQEERLKQDQEYQRKRRVHNQDRLRRFGNENKALLGIRAGFLIIPTFKLEPSPFLYGINGEALSDLQDHLATIKLANIRSIREGESQDGGSIMHLEVVTGLPGTRYESTETIKVWREHLEFAMDRVLS